MVLKSFLLPLVLFSVFAFPARAEVMGVYGGLKFIDSIQSTGAVSKTTPPLLGDLGIKSYAQNTIGGGIFIGYDFYPKFQAPVRAEVEYAIRTNMRTEWNKSVQVGPGTVSHNLKAEWNLQTLFANVYLDFHNSTAFTPYIGGGLGMGFINVSYKGEATAVGPVIGRVTTNQTDGKLNTVFAWNVGAGCSYAVTENFSLDLAYRFVGLGYNEVSGRARIIGDRLKVGFSPYANEFSLGARFTF
jgi:opacity protein-like surface antigen